MARKRSFEFRHGSLTATVSCSIGKTWYIILTNEATNKAWTSGVYGRKEALADALDYISGEKPLPTTILGKIPECKQPYTGTIEQNKRTCNFCARRYPANLFRAHWDVCPGRHHSLMEIKERIGLNAQPRSHRRSAAGPIC